MKTVTYDETKWKLVPIIPTKEMCYVGEVIVRGQIKPENHISDAFEAMIDAAPAYNGKKEG